jgi:hypothetical protein
MGTRALGHWVLMTVAVFAMAGCVGGIQLDERMVPDFASAEDLARSRVAYGRALERLDGVDAGISMPEAERVMGAVIVVVSRKSENGEELQLREKLIEGRLCTVDVSLARRRWLFGYDEDRVVLVGFAIEFEREDPEGEDWVVRQVDRSPRDECPSP